MNRLERVKGCLLGGAVGDALGAPVEFLEWSAIEAMFGPQGITDFVPAYGITGAISDDTQMMLFTAEGLMRAFVRGSSRGVCHVPSIVHHSLLRWLMTQDYPAAIPISEDGWLIKQPELWSRRAPGDTCLRALKASRRLGTVAENNSKGCGALMRVAPCAFFANAFDYAAQSGRLTHGHPTGYLAAGLFADILQRVVDLQDSLEHAVTQSLAKYRRIRVRRKSSGSTEVLVRTSSQTSSAFRAASLSFRRRTSHSSTSFSSPEESNICSDMGNARSILSNNAVPPISSASSLNALNSPLRPSSCPISAWMACL